VNFFIDNWFLFAMAAISGALLLWPLLVKGASGGGGAQISTADAVRLINREKAVLIDVSEATEFAAGHAKGSKSVPLAELEASKALPKNKTLPVVLLCATGNRASRAAVTLKKLGFENALVLAGGFTAWRAANLPVEKTAITT
jgi:rhodanese-related sulfurtransferase